MAEPDLYPSVHFGEDIDGGEDNLSLGDSDLGASEEPESEEDLTEPISGEVQASASQNAGSEAPSGIDRQKSLFQQVVSGFVDLDGKHTSEVFCVRYSPDGKLIATGCGDGVIRVFTNKGHLAYRMNGGLKSGLPMTCVRFRPMGRSSSTKNVIIGTCADGSIQHFHVTSQQCIYRLEEEGNQIYAADYRPDGEMFATAGRDSKVRIYEESTKTLISSMTTGLTNRTTGHSSRVYSVKFNTNNPNMLLTGGWDNTVHIWDVRSGIAERVIFGPHIAGDAIDVNKDDVLLTASWRPERSLQLWDIGTGKVLSDVYWMSSPMLYTAQFSPDGSTIAAGGTGSNETRLFEANGNHKSLGRVRLSENAGVYTLDFGPSGKRMAMAGGGPKVRILTLDI